MENSSTKRKNEMSCMAPPKILLIQVDVNATRTEATINIE